MQTQEVLVISVNSPPATIGNVNVTACDSPIAAQRWLISSKPQMIVIGLKAAEEMVTWLQDMALDIPWYLVLSDNTNPEQVRYWSSRGAKDVWKDTEWHMQFQELIAGKDTEKAAEKRSIFPTVVVQTKERVVLERRTQVVVCAGLHPRAGTTTLAIQLAEVLSRFDAVALLEHEQLDRKVHEMWLGASPDGIILQPPNPLAYRFVVVDVGTEYQDPWAREWLQRAAIILLAVEFDPLLLEQIFSKEAIDKNFGELLLYQNQLQLIVTRGVDGSVDVVLNPPVEFSKIHLGANLTQKELFDACSRQKAPLDGKGGKKMKHILDEFAQFLQPDNSKKRSFLWGVK